MTGDVVKGCYGISQQSTGVEVFGVDLGDEQSVENAIQFSLDCKKPLLFCAVCFESDKGSFAVMNNLDRLLKTRKAVRPICVPDRWNRAAELKKQSAALLSCITLGMSDKGFREFAGMLCKFLEQGGLIFTIEVSMQRQFSVVTERLLKSAERGIFLGAASEECDMNDYTRQVEKVRAAFTKKAEVHSAHGFLNQSDGAYFFIAAGGFDKQTEIEFTEFMLT